MAKINNAAYFPAGTVSLGADEYTAAIESCMLNPATPVAVINDVGGGVQAVSGVTVWTVVLAMLQDLITASSLSQYLIANSGKVVDLAYKPQSGTGAKTFTIKVLIVPGAIGGAGGSVAKASVTLQGVGQPAIA